MRAWLAGCPTARSMFLLLLVPFLSLLLSLVVDVRFLLYETDDDDDDDYDDDDEWTVVGIY